MSGYDSVLRNVSSRVRKVARDGADVTSGGRQFHTWEGKQVKVRSTYIVPQAAYAASATLCVTYMAGIQPKPHTKPALTDFGLQPYSRTKP